MRKWFLLIAVCVIGHSACAQIVNIETKRQAFDTVGLFGQWDIGAQLVQNTASVFTVNTALRIDWVQERSNWLILSDYRMVRAAEQNFINAGFLHLRYGRRVGASLLWETFSQVQYNQQLRLRVRALLGTGPRFQLLERDKSSIYLGTLLMLEYNEIGDAEVVFRDQRISAYLGFALFPTDNLTVTSTTYYQPLLSDLAEARVSTLTNAVFKITEVLSFRTGFSLSYDSRLPSVTPNVPATTYNWTNGLRLKF